MDGKWVSYRKSLSEALKRVICDPERKKAAAPVVESYREKFQLGELRWTPALVEVTVVVVTIRSFMIALREAYHSIQPKPVLCIPSIAFPRQR